MLAYDQVARIQNLLKQTPRLSLTQIARQVGVSRWAVTTVAQNTRANLYKPLETHGECPPHRCGGCGALITTRECVACRTRSQLGSRKSAGKKKAA